MKSFKEICNIDESRFSNAAAALGTAAALSYANTNVEPIEGYDVRYGVKTPTLFHQRMNHELNADQYDYKYDLKDTSKVQVKQDLKTDIAQTKEKILATPTKHLTQYGKDSVNVIATAVVKAAKMYDVDVNILLAILAGETGYNQNAVSHTGVRGIGQITGVTTNDLMKRKKIDQSHSAAKNAKDVTAAIYTAADVINYYSKHMHDNIEMIFAEYNGGSLGGATPYRMYRQGKSKEDIATWLKQNIKDQKTAENTIKHFFGETLPYVEKCMTLYKHYLELDRARQETVKESLTEATASSLDQLKQKLNLSYDNTPNSQLFKILGILHANQTEDEQRNKNVRVRNNAGYSVTDSRILTDLYNWYRRRQMYTEKQRRALIKLLRKHSGQLINHWISTGKIEHVGRGLYQYVSKQERETEQQARYMKSFDEIRSNLPSYSNLQQAARTAEIDRKRIAAQGQQDLFDTDLQNY